MLLVVSILLELGPLHILGGFVNQAFALWIENGLPLYREESEDLERKTEYDNSEYMPPTFIVAEGSKGNVLAEWSTLANGDERNTEYKTTYTYDSEYSIPLIQERKIDTNTTIRIENQLDALRRNVTRHDTYVNSQLVSRTDYAYDAYGNVINEKRYLDDFTDYYLTEYTYEDGAYLAAEIHNGLVTADGGLSMPTPGEAPGVVAFLYAYDDMGRMTSKTDGNGNTTAYRYDNLGNVFQVIYPDGSTVSYDRNYVQNTVIVENEEGYETEYVYTPLGLLYETVDVETDAVLTRYEYDNASRLVKETDYIYGGVTIYTYDAFDRVLSERKKHGNTVLSAVNYVYNDAAENGQYSVVRKTVLGNSRAPSIVTTQYTDQHGNVVKQGRYWDNVEYLDTYEYDYVGNRIWERTAADAARGLACTAEYEYNASGQVTKTYNAMGQSTTNIYDGLGRLIETIDYSGTSACYAYDALDRLLSKPRRCRAER